MSAEAALLTRSWPVGRRRVTVTVPPVIAGSPVRVAFEWDPDLPRHLSPAELRQYRAGRDAALGELSVLIGGTVALVEL